VLDTGAPLGDWFIKSAFLRFGTKVIDSRRDKKRTGGGRARAFAAYRDEAVRERSAVAASAGPRVPAPDGIPDCRVPDFR
jgi:hypothetical protein